MVYCDDSIGSRIADCSMPGHLISTAQTRANTRLIAAAPELLEALQAMVDMYCRLIDSGDCGNWNPRDDVEVRDANKAICKATGAA